MTRHWTSYLPEAGAYFVEEGKSVQSLLTQAKSLLEAAEARDRALMQRALEFYSQDEVALAIGTAQFEKK